MNDLVRVALAASLAASPAFGQQVADSAFHVPNAHPAFSPGTGRDRALGAGAACYARVFLNNTEVYHGRSGEPLFDIKSIPVDMIEAMEVYSAFETPAKYTGLNTCAVVVIWTRITFP